MSAQDAAQDAARDLGHLTAADFEPHLDTPFRLRTSSGDDAELKLAEVRRLGAALREGGAFALVFVATVNPRWSQGIYRLSHPDLGTLEMFLVPIGPFAGGFGYEAVFT
jgi:hypothetical protein